MKLIKSSYQILDQNDFSTVKGIYSAIENAGRTCYKSIGTRYFRIENPENLDLINKLKNDPNIVCKEGPFFDNSYYISIPHKFINNYPELETYVEESINDSANYENLTSEKFVQSLISSKHYAMLEHGTVYLYSNRDFSIWKHLIERYDRNKYSIVKGGLADYDCYITTNLRVLVENDWLDDLKYLCEPTMFHKKRYTVKFTCNRQVSHEFVRHRVFSFAQESTRYCNYTKDKFGNELTFIKPCWINIPDGDIYWHDGINFRMGATKENPMGISVNPNNLDQQEALELDNFFSDLYRVEYTYNKLIKLGWLPQQAATILPNALKTELIMTGFEDDWNHFFELRALGTTGAPHPQAKELAEPLLQEFIRRGYSNLTIET